MFDVGCVNVQCEYLYEELALHGGTPGWRHWGQGERRLLLEGGGGGGCVWPPVWRRRPTHCPDTDCLIPTKRRLVPGFLVRRCQKLFAVVVRPGCQWPDPCAVDIGSAYRATRHTQQTSHKHTHGRPSVRCGRPCAFVCVCV